MRSLLIMVVCANGLMNCGGAEEAASQNGRLLSGGSSAPVTPSVAAVRPDVTLTDSLYLGKATTYQPTFPSGYECIDGTTAIVWAISGPSDHIQISDSNKCRPTIQTTETFEGGEANLQADLRTADNRLIRWQTSIGFQETPVINFSDSDYVQNEEAWVSAAGGSLSASSIDNVNAVLSGAGSVARTGQTARLYLGAWGNYGGLLALTAGTTMVQPNFMIRDFQINAQTSTSNDYSLSASCRLENANYSHIVEGCPFTFETIASTATEIRFSLTLDENQARAAYTGFPDSRKRFKNVFRAGYPWNGYATRPFVIELEVRHRRTSAVAKKTLGQMIISVANQ